jgi:hypothetical protein
VAQIKAEIASHSDNFVLANAYAYDGAAPGHGWIDVKTGSGRWVSANGKLVTLESVTPDLQNRALVAVTETTINFVARTWSRTRREEPAKMVHPAIVDPLTATTQDAHFSLLGVERVDGTQTYHLRSTYSIPSPDGTVRLDVWFSTDRDYLIRYTRTTRTGRVVSSVDNHWLPRTATNLALLTKTLPSGFRQVFVSP